MKNLLHLFFLFHFFFISSQNTRLIYSLNYHPYQSDSLKFDKTFILQIENSSSVFIEKIKFENDSIDRPAINADQIEEFTVMKFNSNNEKYKIVEYAFVRYKIKIDSNQKWVISNENKLISDYKCQKATIDYGGRKWIAWFNSDLNINNGPYVFDGLPGLIFEIYDENNEYKFTLNKIENLKENYHRLKYMNINDLYGSNWKGYKKIMLDFYSNPLRYFGDIPLEIDYKKENKIIQEKLIKSNPIEISEKPKYNEK